MYHVLSLKTGGGGGAAGGGGQQKESGTGKAKDEILLEGEVPLLCVRRTRTSQSARTASQCVD